MTTQELNRDIKWLNKELKRKGYYSESDKTEFVRLYGADREFKYMNRQSILIMFRLNLRYRFIPFHQFGIHIEI